MMKNFASATAILLTSTLVVADESINERRQALKNTVRYTSKNEVALVDFEESQLRFADFAAILGNYSLSDQIELGVVREALYQYAKPLIFVPERTPKDRSFDD